jgi:hypothetical protein
MEEQELRREKINRVTKILKVEFISSSLKNNHF